MIQPPSLRALGRVFAAVLIVGLVAACGTAEQAAPAPPAPEVTVDHPDHPGRHRLHRVHRPHGAFESVEVRARVSGVLQEMLFRPSQPVREGDVLFVIEPEPYEAARDIAVATIQQWEAELARAESDLVAARAGAADRSGQRAGGRQGARRRQDRRGQPGGGPGGPRQRRARSSAIRRCGADLRAGGSQPGRPRATWWASGQNTLLTTVNQDRPHLCLLRRQRVDPPANPRQRGRGARRGPRGP